MEYYVNMNLSRHHTASGLYETSLNSKISLKEAEDIILEYLKSKGIFPGQLVIAGIIFYI